MGKQVVIMAGGTGGHIFPGIAAARELSLRGYEVSWLGTRAGLESKLVPEHNIPLNFISVNGIRGKSMTQKLLAPFMLMKSIFQAWRLLGKLKPKFVLGFGGFVSGPGGLAAWLRRLPLIIHEQNAVAGTTNKLLAKFADKVATAFPNVLPKAQHIGNPVRVEIEKLPVPEERNIAVKEPLKILVLGGSRGARFINQNMPQVAKRIVQASPTALSILHQTGAADVDSTLAHYEKLGLSAEVQPFIDDMAQALLSADLLVCRAGALTISEIAAAGIGSVLIPFPFAIDDHQTANAMYLVEANAAVLVQQSDASIDQIAALISSLISNKNRLQTMAKNARGCAKPQATKVLIDLCEEVVHGE